MYGVIDIETTGLNRFKDKITYVGIGLAKNIGDPLFKRLVFNMYYPEQVEKMLETLDKLRERRVKLVYQNGKFDTLFIHHHHGKLLPIHHDVMLMGTAYELAAEHGLKAMAQRYLGVEDWDIGKKDKTAFNNPTTEKYLRDGDLVYTWELFNFFYGAMDEVQMKAYTELLKPAYLMYRRAEKKGIYLDTTKLKSTQKLYKQREVEKLKILTDEYDINWRSPDQVSKVLFQDEELPVIKLSQKTGKPSSDAKVLKRLASKGYTLPSKLLDYKFYYGANSKFLNRWGKDAEYDGRIHPSFGLTNVMTGRTSCKDPNLQQVPRNPELRTMFTAPPGRVLIEADYSQIELRIAADYANEPTMLRIYREGGDIHTETAMSLTGLTAEQVKGEPRSKAKAVNFGFLYGMSAKGFIGYAFDSYNTVFSRPEAERYRELFFAKYSRLIMWHKEMEVLCEALGGVENRFGRFRALPDIYAQSNYERSGAVRRAINTPVQSTASDLLLLAAVEIDRKLRKELDLHIVGTVHDSILMDCPEENAEAASREIKRIMAHPEGLDVFGVSFKVPIEAEIAVGAWGSK